MSMLGRRKPKESLSKTGMYIRAREEAGLELPPTMRRGSKEYVKCSYWQTLKQRTCGEKEFVDSARNAAYKRMETKLLISKEEFNSWVDANWEAFASLYSEGKIPSIDRIDKAGHYEATNMAVIDLKENMAKDRRKPVIATPVDGGEEIEFASAKDAHAMSRDDASLPNFNNKNISSAIKRSGTRLGYAWRFK